MENSHEKPNEAGSATRSTTIESSTVAVTRSSQFYCRMRVYGFGIWERKRVEGGLRDFELIFERDTVQTLDEREMYK